MVLIQKRLYKPVVDVGTDPMDGDSLVREGAVVGSVVDASSRGDHHLAVLTAGGVTVRRLVSQTCVTFVLTRHGTTA